MILLPMVPLSRMIVHTIPISLRANQDPDFLLANSTDLDTYHYCSEIILFPLISLECTRSQTNAYRYSSRLVLNSFAFLYPYLEDSPGFRVILRLAQ